MNHFYSHAMQFNSVFLIPREQHWLDYISNSVFSKHTQTNKENERNKQEYT